MVPVSIPKAEIDRHRSAQLHRAVDHIGEGAHQLRCSGKGLCPGRSELDDQKLAFRGCAGIKRPAGSSISGSDPGNRRPVPGDVYARYDRQRALSASCRKRTVDVLRAVFPVQSLIPQIADPRRSVRVAEVLIEIADPLSC